MNKATVSKGRQGYCIIFYHPVKVDGKKIRVRRGLGTRDVLEAENLVKQMNVLLNDKSFWNKNERSRAEESFNPRIVAAFYDHLKGWPEIAFKAEECVSLMAAYAIKEKRYTIGEELLQIALKLKLLGEEVL